MILFHYLIYNKYILSIKLNLKKLCKSYIRMDNNVGKIYYAVGNGSASVLSIYDSSVNSSATASATSTISQEDAQNMADELANSLALRTALNEVNIINQSVTIVKDNLILNNDSGSTGLSTSTGSTRTISNNFSLTGFYYSDYIYYNHESEKFEVSSDSKIHIGPNSGLINQEKSSIAIGNYSGYSHQGKNGISLGFEAGYTNQNENSIAIGNMAGNAFQSFNSISIGNQAGLDYQSSESIAIGNNAGSNRQSSKNVAIGSYAGYNNQKNNSIAIGTEAGYQGQKNNSIAIGNQSGYNNQGENSIVIGNLAGFENVEKDSIIFNASKEELNSYSSGFYVNPIEQDNNYNDDSNKLTCDIDDINVLTYNTNTKQIQHIPIKALIENYLKINKLF